MIASYKYKPVIRIKDSVAMCHSVPAFTTFFEKSRMQRMGICFLTQHDRSRIFYHGLAVTVKEYNNICLKYGEGEILLPLRGFAPRKYSRLGRVRVARSRYSLFAHSLVCASSATGGACLAPSRGRSRSNLF